MFWGVAPNAVLTAAVTGASASGSYRPTSMNAQVKWQGGKALPRIFGLQHANLDGIIYH